MSNLREAAQQALEALKLYVSAYNYYWRIEMDILEPDGDDAISKLEAALAQPDDKAQPVDSWLLDWIQENTCDLRCIDVQTGADDADVQWIVVEHHMAAPREREIGRSYNDDPRDAIRAAIISKRETNV